MAASLGHALFLNASDAEQFNDLIGHVHRSLQENKPECVELLGDSAFLASSSPSGLGLRRMSSYNLIVVGPWIKREK